MHGARITLYGPNRSIPTAKYTEFKDQIYNSLVCLKAKLKSKEIKGPGEN